MARTKSGTGLLLCVGVAAVFVVVKMALHGGDERMVIMEDEYEVTVAKETTPPKSICNPRQVRGICVCLSAQ